MNLTTVKRFTIPRTIVTHTEENLRRAGRQRLELFVLWSGIVEGDLFVVRSAHIPPQTSYQLETGLMVRVEGEALHHLNTWLFDHSETLAIQVHAHPTEAFHSDTDDTYPIVTADGSISIVAADFCRWGIFSDTSAVYRLSRHRWREVRSPSTLLEVA